MKNCEQVARDIGEQYGIWAGVDRDARSTKRRGRPLTITRIVNARRA